MLLLLGALLLMNSPPPPSPAPAADADARPRLTLRWRTASEVDNYGFFVTRAEKEDGPFTTLNARILPGAGNSDVPRSYVYEDFAVEPGRTYWYAVDSVSTKGERERFSPVFSKQCCSTPSPAPSAAPSPGSR